MNISKSRVHINISVRDLDKSIGFYTTLFGTVPSKVRSDYANWRLDSPSIHLALTLDSSHEPKTKQDHFGVEVFSDDELNAWGVHLEAAGLNPRTEEAVTCCYAVANKRWVQDPDGNEWELWVRHDDAESMHEPATETANEMAESCSTDASANDAPC